MEKELLTLLDDFNSGKLRAFGKQSMLMMQQYIFLIDLQEIKYFDNLYSLVYDHLGQDCSMEQMEGIRDQQESLARLHFELTTKQDLTQPMSEDGKNLSFAPSFSTSDITHRIFGFEPSSFLKYDF